jgi:hypothetical protein
LFEDEADKSKVIGDYILNTVSITSISKTWKEASVHYWDRLNDVQLIKQLPVKFSLIRQMN